MSSDDRDTTWVRLHCNDLRLVTPKIPEGKDQHEGGITPTPTSSDEEKAEK